MIRELFKERRRRFLNRCLKYSRYVFNDHFVLVLMFLLGFVLFQYSQLLRHFPENPWAIGLALLVLCLVLPFWGGVATYLEAPDQHYLLVEEEAVLAQVKAAVGRGYRFWVVIQTLILLLVAPLFLALGWPIWGVALVILVLALAKYVIIRRKTRSFYATAGLNWSQVIETERKRQQSILKFFSLFTTVKGITSTVKRRAYLDWLLKAVSKKESATWSNLYWRAFLRSGDYFGLAIRLFVLALLATLLVRETWLAMVLAGIFNYLLLFQLTALKGHFAYQTMANLMPVGKDRQSVSLQGLISQLILEMTLVEAICLWNWRWSLILVVVMLVLILLYLPYKLKKMID